jgi:hypothetical protein
MMLIELALLRLSRFKRLAPLDTQGLELLVALHPRVWWARRAGQLASVRRASSKAPNTPNLETRDGKSGTGDRASNSSGRGVGWRREREQDHRIALSHDDFSRDVLASSPDICPGQISWDYDRAEIIADGVVHAIGVCLGAHRRDDRRDRSQHRTHRNRADSGRRGRPGDDARALGCLQHMSRPPSGFCAASTTSRCRSRVESLGVFAASFEKYVDDFTYLASARSGRLGLFRGWRCGSHGAGHTAWSRNLC